MVVPMLHSNSSGLNSCKPTVLATAEESNETALVPLEVFSMKNWADHARNLFLKDCRVVESI